MNPDVVAAINRQRRKSTNTLRHLYFRVKILTVKTQEVSDCHRGNLHVKVDLNPLRRHIIYMLLKIKDRNGKSNNPMQVINVKHDAATSNSQVRQESESITEIAIIATDIQQFEAMKSREEKNESETKSI